MLRDLRKAWRQAGLDRLVRADTVDKLCLLLVHGNPEQLAALPRDTGIEQNAVIGGFMLHVRKVAKKVNLIAMSAQLERQLSVFNDCVAQAIIEARASIPHKLSSDRDKGQWLASTWAKNLERWVIAGVVAMPKSGDIIGHSDLNRIGEFIGTESERAHIVAGWQSILVLSKMAVSGTRSKGANAYQSGQASGKEAV